jgi:serine/threonine-protein kinase
VDTLSFDQWEAEHDARIGRAVGNYHILSRIGEGGFGTVYRARDVRLDRLVALKFLRQPLLHAHGERFAREAKVLAGLRHPGIVQIHAWGEDGGQPYFVTDLYDQSAATLLAEHPDGLPAHDALRIVTDCARALQVAHESGIVHGDIKPENILLDAKSGHAVLADFGLARLSGEEPADSSRAAGSPPYMAPEQLRGAAPDVRSDVYGLGATLYRLLTGRAPFEGNARDVQRQQDSGSLRPVDAAHAGLPVSLAAVVHTALAKAPSDRYSSVTLFLQAIVDATQPTPNGRIAATRRRPGLALGAALSAIVIAIVILGVVMPAVREIRGEGPGIVLADATAQLEHGDLDQARASFEAYLAEHPASDEALYGLGYALLLEGEALPARDAFERIGDAALRAEGLAAAVHAAAGREARPDLESAAATAGTGYPQVLLASLDLAEGQYSAAAERLNTLDPSHLRFDWQRNQYLQTLGQSYFRQGDFQNAVRAFTALSQQSEQQSGGVAQEYLELSRRQLDTGRREQVSAQVARVKQLLQDAPAPSPADQWTSRPIAVWLAPAQVRNAAIAMQSGLADVLPWKLGKQLLANEDIPLDPVERELNAEVLAEQELSAQLSPEADSLRLGRVLGARLIVQPEFSTVFNEETLRLSLVDTETTRLVPVGEYAVTRTIDPEAWVDQLVQDLWAAVRKAYPPRGILQVQEGKATLNIGSAVGVKPGVRFQVFANPDTGQRLDGITATATDVSESSTAVSLEGAAASDVPAAGWYVEARPDA